MGIVYPALKFVAELNWDSWLFLLISLLLAVNFGLLYSAGSEKIATLIRHSAHVFVGLGVFIVMTQMSPHTFKRWTPILYGICLILLIGVLLIGTASKGAQRWVNLGFFRFQPSELMKLMVPLMLAYYLDNKILPLRKTPILISLAIILFPALLIAKQPDLGTSLLIMATGFGVLLFAGVRWAWVIKMSAIVLAALPLLWWILHDYQRQRVLTFLNPERDPLGSGYHIIQSKIAIGSGGLYGKGWCQGTKHNLVFYLNAPPTLFLAY